ncbi:lycopene cyclase family protein [Frigoribacterium salinisoli]
MTGTRAAGVQDTTVLHPRGGTPAPLTSRTVDVVVLGGGCSGLAVALQLAERAPDLDVVVLEGRTRPDRRVWCSWDDASDPVPEAGTASWDRWEVRTRRGTSTGADPEHPYRMVRADDRRTAVDRRLEGRGRVTVLDGAPVHDHDRLPDGRYAVSSGVGRIEARQVVDATGRGGADPVRGTVLLHQRFVGLWIETVRPVFDPTTVTLMDFTSAPADQVRFVYVLPVSPTVALVESTVFTPERHAPVDFRAHVHDYVRDRWTLHDDEWTVTGSESGCVPMTDAPSRRPSSSDGSLAVVAGVVRPSSGYGYARAHRHARVVVDHLLAGTPAPAFRDRTRTRALDAVFLRFLRHRPGAAPEAFRRLFTLPGPLVVRFLTERSTLVDELRIVLVLPKAPFLGAAVRTLQERLAARWTASRAPSLRTATT